MNCPKCGADLRKRSAIRRHIDGCYVEPGCLQTDHCAADLCNSVGIKQSIGFDGLSDAVQSAIIQNKFGDRELTLEDEAELRALSQDELFEAWSSVIHAAHKEIYK